jgi:hypothetical protein
MKLILTFAAGLLLAAAAQAGDVYVTKDAKGNRVYTDRPQTLPAEKAGIESASTDPTEVEARYEEEMKRYAADDASATKAAATASDAKKAAALKAEDKAQRCVEARKRYQASMESYHLYVVGPDGQRQYLDSAEIDRVRADAKRSMDEFCGGQ